MLNVLAESLFAEEALPALGGCPRVVSFLVGLIAILAVHPVIGCNFGVMVDVLDLL